MRFAITSEHKAFYKRFHYIEFENLLSEEQLLSLRNDINQHMDNKIHSKDKQVWDYILAGRDVWRESESIRKISLSRKFAEIAASLTDSHDLRIAYDQCIKTPKHPAISPVLSSHFEKKLSLKQSSCFQNIVSGVVFHISEDVDENDLLSLSIREDLEILTPLPQKPGSAVFFSPEAPLDFFPFFEKPNGLYLLIVYCADPGLYVLEENDVHTHELKKLGYAFGDKLSKNTHPILFSD